MVERYLTGSLIQSLERARQLRQIVQRTYPREYDGLRQICLHSLDDIQSHFQSLAQETIVDTALQTPLRVRQFKRIVEHLNWVEGIGVFALGKMGSDDRFLNRLITVMCDEAVFPLIFPTICHISQDYFHIYPGFNLLCVPLLESRFLLHLPDIYHELCHLFHHRTRADIPSLHSYRVAYEKSQFEMVKHFQDRLTAADRVRKSEGLLAQIHLQNTSWARYWMQEFFCDLFAVMTAGPAFAWSHFHLCIKRGGDPFDTPLVSVSTHPADDARMRISLQLLKLMDFEVQAAHIEKAWQTYIELMGYSPSPEYRQCYPETLLSAIVSAAQVGIEGIGVVTAKPDSLQPIVRLLNDAWQEFWRAPEEFQTWEEGQMENLRATVNGERRLP